MSESTWNVWREAPCVEMTDRRAVASDLARHIREFLESGTYSAVRPAVVDHMEGLVLAFPDSEWYEDLVVPLASYEPSASDEGPFYSTEQLGDVLRSALPAIDAQASRDIAER
ncbi:MAG TPA: hypothetical protein VE011_07020 [Candidatus Dormibacteraeota bacterium]|nr:hypothetical protein [Candidatus Dormibacteraeota bacterium]